MVTPSLASARTAGDVDDAALVARVRAGDDRAFEKLYERYHRRIAAYIYGMVNDYGRAEDIAQDVFLSALRRLRQTDRPVAFKPWMYEIAKNACIDQFRRSRRGEEISIDAQGALGATDQVRLTSTRQSPHAAVDQKLTLDNLRGAFGGLSETHHQIIVMRELEGLSYQEIGERLGMSRPSVESTLFRARRRLTEEYEELTSGARCVRVQSIIAQAAGTAPGARDERRMAAHISHCQSCRRAAVGAGLDVAALARSRPRAKIAALLPLPEVLRWRLAGEAGVPASHGGTVARWSVQASSVDPSMATWGKAVAAAATLAVAGIGIGAGSRHLTEQGRPKDPATVASTRVPARVLTPPARPVVSAPAPHTVTAQGVRAAFSAAFAHAGQFGAGLATGVQTSEPARQSSPSPTVPTPLLPASAVTVPAVSTPGTPSVPAGPPSALDPGPAGDPVVLAPALVSTLTGAAPVVTPAITGAAPVVTPVIPPAVTVGPTSTPSPTTVPSVPVPGAPDAAGGVVPAP